jgi:hypothetical protein
MKVYFLFNQRLGVPKDKCSLELISATVTELKALLHELDCCLVFQAIKCDCHHLAHPAEVLLLNVYVQSHVWDSFEVETTVLISTSYSLKPIRDFSNASANDFDLQISAVFLHQTGHLSSSCRIGLFNYQVRDRCRHDKGHASTVTAIIHDHTSLNLVFEQVNCDSPETNSCCKTIVALFICGCCTIWDKLFGDSRGLPCLFFERIGLLQAVNSPRSEALLVLIQIVVDHPHTATYVSCFYNDGG